jgi:hypothetical protein
VRTIYLDVAATIRETLSDPECEQATQLKIAAFARRASDLFRQGDPAFSYDWFFGACGLDNWGELLRETESK